MRASPRYAAASARQHATDLVADTGHDVGDPALPRSRAAVLHQFACEVRPVQRPDGRRFFDVRMKARPNLGTMNERMIFRSTENLLRYSFDGKNSQFPILIANLAGLDIGR
jgi:hypothetical protein